MTEEQFAQIVAMFPDLERLKLQGFGEPLLNPSLFAMINHAKRQGTVVETFTNGSLLHLGDRARRLMATGIDVVRISVDGGSAQTFEKLRPGSSFCQVMENSRLLVEAGLQYGEKRTRVEWWVVATPTNVPELSTVVELAADSGIQTVFVQMELNTYTYKAEIGDQLVAEHASKSVGLEESLHLANETAGQCGVDLRLEYTKAYSGTRMCHWPFDSAFISVEGFVVPCCTIADPQVVNFGNVFEYHFDAIWHGEAYSSFRKTILEHRLTKPCQLCYATKTRGSQ